jgi:hypothetical protein
MGQGYSEVLVTQQAAGTLFNAYTTAKTVLNPQALFTIPAGDAFWKIGKRLRVTIEGGLSNIVTTPGTVTFQVMIGGVIVWTSGAIQLNATAHTTLPFRLEVNLTCRSLGSSTNGTLMGIGTLTGVMFTLTAGQTDATNTPPTLMVPATAPAVGTGFDTTIANIIDFFAGFSINNSGNGIQVQQYTVEALN